MKKWGALAIVLFLGIMLAIQHSRKSREAAVTQPAGDEGGSVQTGVPLPAEARNPAVYNNMQSNAAAQMAGGGFSSYSSPLPAVAVDRKGECKGGALNDILYAHGNIWSFHLQTQGLPYEVSFKLYNMLSRYFSCVALAERSISPCDHLPGERLADKKEDSVKYVDSPHFACREGYKELALSGFVAGKSDDSSIWQMVAAEEGGKDIPGDFLVAAAKGRGTLCSSMAKQLTPEQLKNCNAYFPSGQNVCRGDSKCLRRDELLGALESGRPDRCQEGQKELCRAYLSKDDSACAGMLKELSEFYCKNLAGLSKKTGMSVAELMARGTTGKTETDREKTEKEMRRLEDQKIIEGINKNIRAIKKMGNANATE